MKHVIFLVSLLTFLAVGCSVETMNVGDGGKTDGAAEDQKERDGGEEQSPEPSTDGAPAGETEETGGESVTVTTTTTTTVETGAGKKAEPKAWSLASAHENTDFVSDNYCRGSNLHDCWIKSATLRQDGESFMASIEFWDTAEASEPYAVKKKTFAGKTSILLTTEAKILGDDALEYRFLWAVIDPEALTLDVVYDYGEDGPSEQGDDLLESFVFTSEEVPN